MRDMNKHIVKADDNQPFHTSGYAQIATGNRIGSVSTISFEQRQKIELNRQKIAGYNRSAIGRSCGALRAKSVTDTNVTNRNAINQRSTTPTNQPVSTPRVKYDPFA